MEAYISKQVQATSEIDPSEDYATLSHCWGPPSTDKSSPYIAKLTPASKQTLEAGVPLEKLPKTFSDAIIATRAIGLKYLWIDSLCIIQEEPSKADWQRESAHMGEVYTNSLCTFAATHGSNNKAGCFVTRDPGMLEPCPYSPPSLLNSRYGRSEFYVVDQDLWTSAISKAPLNRRGWVLQERLLAPRTVSFCAKQVFWECAQLAACEIFPSGLPEKLLEQRPNGERIPANRFKIYLKNAIRNSAEERPTGYRNPYIRGLGTQPRPSPSSSAAYDHWNFIVSEYSRCALTYATDRIIAISGVAKQLQPAINDTFIAGLWKNHLPHGLAWHRGETPIPPLGKRDMSGAPSWSWASLAAEVSFPSSTISYQEWESKVSIMECRAISKDGSGFGQFLSAVLSLRGPLQQMTVEQGKLRRQARLPACRPWFLWIGNFRILSDANILALDEMEMEECVGKALFVTPLLYGCGLGRNGIDLVRGLVLERCGVGKYQRVGLLSLNGREGDPKLEILFHAMDYDFEVL
jgi:hypothetical protein